MLTKEEFSQLITAITMMKAVNVDREVHVSMVNVLKLLAVYARQELTITKDKHNGIEFKWYPKDVDQEPELPATSEVQHQAPELPATPEIQPNI